MKWDVKHDRAKKVIDRFLDNAGYWQESEDLVAGLTDEEAEHHLIFGTAGRELSEKDGLKIPVCNNCHNMGQKLCRIHENPMAERLSKMLGQAIWEKEWISANNQQESRKAREAFRKRYGRSYL